MKDGGINCSKLNNKGLSLVELIVAISIGVIVSGAIAALISFSVRMYRNESVNTTMQYELQSNINMIMDEIMGAQTFVVVQNGTGDIDHINTTDNPTDYLDPYTDYVLLGSLSGSPVKFKGVVFASSALSGGKCKIYMNRLDKELAGKTLEEFADDEATAARSDIYLLGDNVTQFAIEPVATSFSSRPNPENLSETLYEYTNPIEFVVKISFEKDAWKPKKYKKHVEDMTYLRNKVSGSVYVDGTEYTLKKKDE